MYPTENQDLYLERLEDKLHSSITACYTIRPVNGMCTQ